VGSPDWDRLYAETHERVSELARQARPTLCGFSACVDVNLPMDGAVARLRGASEPAAQALAAELERRAGAGIGGEIAVDWPGGPAWLERHCSGEVRVGGTAAQAAVTLATLGAPAVLALNDRSTAQLAVLSPDVLLATAAGMAQVQHVCGSGRAKPAHYLFEYTAGQAVGRVIPPRSTRVIVRFQDDDLEWDDYFAEASAGVAREAGAAILSGFNAVPPANLPDSLAQVASIARRWRGSGLEVVHLECADYPQAAKLTQVLDALGGDAATSLGMSASELDRLRPGPEAPPLRAVAVGEAVGVRRVWVHGDNWALCASRWGEPDRDLEALLAGCLVAASRAAAGGPAPVRWPLPGVELSHPSWPLSSQVRGWTVTSCAAPYLPVPIATVGLGDSFLAGCLLEFGQT
jgi:ADP-dependent phosphofructokinase/glucokinase